MTRYFSTLRCLLHLIQCINYLQRYISCAEALLTVTKENGYRVLLLILWKRLWLFMVVNEIVMKCNLFPWYTHLPCGSLKKCTSLQNMLHHR